MRHYTTWPTATGVAVCYVNHRGEAVGVMECPNFATAAREAEALTRQEQMRAMLAAGWQMQPGNQGAARGF